MEKKTKRITFIVNEEWHKDIKKRATECGVTMQRWIEKALQREREREDKGII